MSVENLRPEWMMVLALVVGVTTSYAWAIEPVYTEPLPLDDLAVPAEAVADTEADRSALPAPTATPCVCCNSFCCTKQKKEAASEKMKGVYKGVFYLSDYSYLDDPCYDGPSFPGDGLKGLCGGRLDIGGEVRVRYQNEMNHRGLGVTGIDDEFWLTRYRMFANYRMNQYFRFYGEYLYADSGGESLNNRIIEENRGEIQNLFFDTKLTQDLTLRLGRQEMQFGAQRLVSPLDWANTRRTFDGGRLLYEGDVWNVDGFFMHPVNRIFANESKIDDTNENIDFFGIYASRSDLAIGTVDAYYLGLDVNSSFANFDYHTLGTRVAGQTDSGLLYEFEGGVQFGQNSPGYGNHDAGFFTGGLGRKLRICTRCGEWNPTVWFWYDWASGGDDVPAALGDNSFDHMFPLAHKYLGFIDLFGRRNINDVNAQFITPILGSKVKLLLWYHYFFLDQKTTPYSVVLTPYNAANAAGDRELGHEIDVLFSITLNPRNSALVGYSYFHAGDYYATTAGIPNAAPPRADVDAQFFYMQYQMRF